MKTIKIEKIPVKQIATAKVIAPQDYEWFVAGNKRALTVGTKKSTTITSGDKFGVRKSSNGKETRLITEKDGANKVFTLDSVSNNKLMKDAKKTRVPKAMIANVPENVVKTDEKPAKKSDKTDSAGATKSKDGAAKSKAPDKAPAPVKSAKSDKAAPNAVAELIDELKGFFKSNPEDKAEFAKAWKAGNVAKVSKIIKECLHQKIQN
jgi:hypothetical protein